MVVSLAACGSDEAAVTPAPTTTAPATDATAPATDATDATSAPATDDTMAPTDATVEPSADPSSEPAGPSGGSLIFGAAGAPSHFDPLYATDGETFRVVRQMSEGLITFAPGTADVAPALAESWTTSEDGLTWDFAVRQGVTFHDGTPLDAEAVCYNFDRMYNQTGAGATQAQYWADTMGGFADQTDVDSLYESCTATDAATAQIKITRYTSKFPAILGLPSFSIQSPTALEQYDANNVVAEGESFIYPSYAMEHPTGTGPFIFGSYDQANQTVTLLRNENYWGDKALLDELIFRIIPDETARRQELEAGTIDGYDLPNSGDWQALTDAGANVQVRPAFNILYVGFNPSTNPALKDLNVRKALAMALNREEFVSSQLPEGAEVALEFYPDTVDGWTDTVEKYDYNPEMAKQMLADAGYADLTIDFWWPTEVSRPYMPAPENVFQAFKADLEAIGVTVTETSKPWNGGYLDGVEVVPAERADDAADMFLLGWTGDYNTPDNFIGTFFSGTDNRFGTEGYEWGTQLSDDLKAADSIPDDAERTAAYVKLNEQLLGEYLPAIPISSSPPAIVVAGNVTGLVPSPLTDEKFNTVSKG